MPVGLRVCLGQAVVSAEQLEGRDLVSRAMFKAARVLSKNLLTVPEDEIPSTEVVYTIVGGRVMYRR